MIVPSKRKGLVARAGLALLLGAFAVGATQAQFNVRMGKTTNSTGSHGSIRQCSDLDVSFGHDLRVAHAEQTLTIPRASAQTLRAHLEGPSGMTVFNGGTDYSVQVCKYAAATYATSSDEKLDAINVSAENGEIRTKVPDDDNWMVYLIIQAPAGVGFDLSTHDGQMELRDLAGNIKAHVENGPLTLDHCTGEVEGATVNGPLDVNGSSGRMHLRTENGPLSVKLEGDRWENGGLEGSTSNGPLSLDVARGYLSGVVVKADGYSPMSCSGCSNEQRTWDNNSKQVEIGKEPVVIRLSTHNGPVRVDSRSSSREDME